MMNRKLEVKRPIALEEYMLLRARSREGGPVEPWGGFYALRKGDIVEVTFARARQLLLTSPETFELRGKPELWEFLDACCEEAEGGEVELEGLWRAYEDWAREQGKPPMPRETFERELSEIFEVVQSEKGPSFRGLRLKEEK